MRSIGVPGAVAVICFSLQMTSGFTQTRDIKPFVQEAFHDEIEAIKSGIYCRALSCDFGVESFLATETDPKTYTISASGWLEGTIPGIHGSAKRSMGLVGSYTQGTCVVRDLKPIFDTTTNNNGWGASRIETVFKKIKIPENVVLTPEACNKVDGFIFAAAPGVPAPGQ